MFDYVFSIGSLEHFTEAGLVATISGARPICRGINFHMVAVVPAGSMKVGSLAPKVTGITVRAGGSIILNGLSVITYGS